jgi:flagellar assembly protein FliH
MTGLSQFLDDFGASAATVTPEEPGIDPQEVEAQRLESFEEGYRAGWDDAVKAQKDESSQVSSALAQRLSDLSFTYLEAQSAMTKSMMPLLQEMVSTVLPKLARQNLGAHLAEQINGLVAEIGAVPVEIAVAPGQRAVVEPLIDGDHGLDVTIVEDASLTEDQADIRFAENERQVDLGALIEQVASAVEGFGTETQRNIANG